MKARNVLLAVAVCLVAAGTSAYAQDQAQAQPDSSAPVVQAPEQAPPPMAYQVPVGTRFLVALAEPLSTKEDKGGKKFTSRTLEPLAAADGTLLPEGAEIRGHIDKVVPAGKAGRARMWLTFDEIRTPRGWRPLVAGLIDAPGVHSIRVLYDHEGEIVGPSSKKEQEEEVVAEAALVGAAPGVAAKNAKEAAMGAGMGAVTAFLTTSGLGQELTIEKDTKLELVIERPLALGRN